MAATLHTTVSGPTSRCAANGLATDWNGAFSGRGSSDLATSQTAGATAMAAAHQRQRGDGNDPVGMSSTTKARQVRATSVAASAYTAT